MMLKSVRQRYVDAGWVRYTCNKGVKRIRTIFKWGVENEMVAPATLQGLQAVAPLLAGRTVAKVTLTDFRRLMSRSKPLNRTSANW